jgi:hypothetical protein
MMPQVAGKSVSLLALMAFVEGRVVAQATVITFVRSFKQEEREGKGWKFC